MVISNKPGNRNSSRRQILLEELTKEQRLLSDTNELLAQNTKMKVATDSKGYQQRNAILKDAINEHQRNINILNKQLGYAPK